MKSEAEWYSEEVEMHSTFTEKHQQLVTHSHNNARLTNREEKEKTKVIIQN